MNKKILFPLALVPLAATGLQTQKSAQTQRVDKRPQLGKTERRSIERI